MCFLITADGLRPFLLHPGNLKQNNEEWDGAEFSLIADQGAAWWSASFLQHVLKEL